MCDRELVIYFLFAFSALPYTTRYVVGPFVAIAKYSRLEGSAPSVLRKPILLLLPSPQVRSSPSQHRAAQVSESSISGISPPGLPRRGL